MDLAHHIGRRFSPAAWKSGLVELAGRHGFGARQSAGESHLPDPTLLTALEALLNVLPPGVASAGRKKPDAILTGAANDFEALERLRKLAFSETVPAPKIPEQIPLALGSDSEEEETA